MTSEGSFFTIIYYWHIWDLILILILGQLSQGLNQIPKGDVWLLLKRLFLRDLDHRSSHELRARITLINCYEWNGCWWRNFSRSSRKSFCNTRPHIIRVKDLKWPRHLIIIYLLITTALLLLRLWIICVWAWRDLSYKLKDMGNLLYLGSAPPLGVLAFPVEMPLLWSG